jgi:hypothetical protein
MKALNAFFGVLILAAAVAASPAALGSILAGLAGLFLMASTALPGMAGMVQPMPPAAAPAPIAAHVAHVSEPLRVFELEGGGGVVVFRTINGKLVSRMYRVQSLR